MSNIERDFRTKAAGAVPSFSERARLATRVSGGPRTQTRAERVVAAGRGGATNPIRLGVGEIMPETAGHPSRPNFTIRGSVPAGNTLVPTDGFDPAMRGKTSPLPPTPMAPPAPMTPPQVVGNPIYAGRLQSPGIYNPNGSTSSFDSTQMRAERAVAAGRGGATNPIRLGVGEIMPETAGRPSAPNFTLRGSVPAGNALVPTDGFDPAMRGKTSPLPPLGRALSDAERAAFEASPDGKASARTLGMTKAPTPAPTPTPPPEGMFQRVGPNPNAGIGVQPSMAQRAGRMVGETLGKNGGGGLGGALGAAGVAAQGLIMDHDGMRSQFYDDPKVSGFDKLRQGARDVKTLALPAAAGIVGGSAGALAGPVGAIAGGVGGAVLGGAADRYIESGLGASALDAYKERYAKAVAPTSTPVATEPAAQQPTLSPWNRSDDLATEAKRQFTNATPIQDGGNGLLARAEAGLSRARGQYAQGGEGGARAFRDPAVQAAFNARNMLEGTGIAVNTTKDGRTEFSGDNRAGGGQLYRAADGSVTNDWSKTQQYADAIQRNAKDQDRLAELTRGAALSGDKEALARLTHGDQRLAGIAAEAATEKSLRDAVKGGSRNAAMVLADMEKSKATQAYRNVDLGLKRAALVSAQEDRDLNRQLRQDSLNVKVAENKRVAEKDTRETAQARVTTLDKQLEQYATVKGELDGQKVARLRGLAANLQPSPGQSPEEFNKDVTTHVGLASKLDGMQAFYDRWFSQAGQGGTDLRQWKPNDSIRGGFVTDQGDHISTGQYNSLTDDEKAVFKKLYLKGGK